MDSTPSTRSRHRSPRASTASSSQKGSAAAPPGQNAPSQDWTEPPLASPVPSFEEHGGGPYGVLEDMQALGSRPSAKVRARVKPDAARKSLLNKTLTAAALAEETPEPTPAPPELLPELQPLVIVDDERDDDYTPRPSKKPAKSRLSRSAAATKSVASPKTMTPSAAASETPAPSSVATPVASATPVPPPTSSKPSVEPLPKSEQSTPAPGEEHDLKAIVEAAVKKSLDIGNKYLGLAIQEVYLESRSKPHLAALLRGILDQTATPQEMTEFREHINQAKKKLKAQNGASKKNKPKEKKQTSSPPPELIPRPSIENQVVPHKPKISLKMSKTKKPATNPPTPPPATKMRASSVSSSSSLSSLTSIDEELPPPPLMGMPQRAPADEETGASLVAPAGANGTLKRSSVEAGNDENDRIFQAKKQKFDKTVNREVPTEESHIRPDLSAKARKNLIVPPVQLTANGIHSRDHSVDVASPLTEMSSPFQSRKGTPVGGAMPTKKKAKTKHS